MYAMEESVGRWAGQMSRQARDLEQPASKCLAYCFRISFFRSSEEEYRRYALLAKDAPKNSREDGT